MYSVCTGEDPLVDDQTDHDINSVAGVLKLYFRGLENPLFPKECFLDLISTTSKSHHWHQVWFPFWMFRTLTRSCSVYFRARLGCRKSSSTPADNCDSSAACDHCHEILVCISEPVSQVTTDAFCFTRVVKGCQSCLVFPVFLSTVMKTWWIPTTWLFALGLHWCQYQMTRTPCPARLMLMRSLRPLSFTMRPSFQPSVTWRDLCMKSAWLVERSTGKSLTRCPPCVEQSSLTYVCLGCEQLSRKKHWHFLLWPKQQAKFRSQKLTKMKWDYLNHNSCACSYLYLYTVLWVYICIFYIQSFFIIVVIFFLHLSFSLH